MTAYRYRPALKWGLQVPIAPHPTALADFRYVDITDDVLAWDFQHGCEWLWRNGQFVFSTAKGVLEVESSDRWKPGSLTAIVPDDRLVGPVRVLFGIEGEPLLWGGVAQLTPALAFGQADRLSWPLRSSFQPVWRSPVAHRYVAGTRVTSSAITPAAFIGTLLDVAAAHHGITDRDALVSAVSRPDQIWAWPAVKATVGQALTDLCRYAGMIPAEDHLGRFGALTLADALADTTFSPPEQRPFQDPSTALIRARAAPWAFEMFGPTGVALGDEADLTSITVPAGANMARLEVPLAEDVYGIDWAQPASPAGSLLTVAQSTTRRADVLTLTVPSAPSGDLKVTLRGAPVVATGTLSHHVRLGGPLNTDPAVFQDMPPWMAWGDLASVGGTIELAAKSLEDMMQAMNRPSAEFDLTYPLWSDTPGQLGALPAQLRPGHTPGSPCRPRKPCRGLSPPSGTAADVGWCRRSPSRAVRSSERVSSQSRRAADRRPSTRGRQRRQQVCCRPLSPISFPRREATAPTGPSQALPLESGRLPECMC